MKEKQAAHPWLFDLGVRADLKPYEKRRALIFNYANTVGFCVALVRVLYMIVFSANHYRPDVLTINCLPLVVSTAMAVCMYAERYRLAIAVSFIFFPPVIVLLKLHTYDQGAEMYLVLYLLFAFFFLYRKRQIVVAVLWILFCWGTTHVLNTVPALRFSGVIYPFDLGLSLINYATAFVLILFVLNTIKFEVWKYEQSIRKQKGELKQLNHVKDKVFSVISHDLRTPILSIIMLLRNMEQESLSPDDIKRLLPDMIDNMEETSELLGNLLIWARGQIRQTELNATNVSIADLTQQTIRFLNRQASSKRIRLVNDVQQECTAYADRDSLEIVMRNLVANAIKFTASGGYVKMSCVSTDGFVDVSVEDNGIGIPPEKQDLLFNNDFYTTAGTANEKGTGLGLFICREIIHKNGGRLVFNSEKGKGTKFTFSVPA